MEAREWPTELAEEMSPEHPDYGEPDPTRPEEVLPHDLVLAALEQGGFSMVRQAPPNMNRIYRLIVEPDLFGGWRLYRLWGRRGNQVRQLRQRSRSGRPLVDYCPSIQDLEQKLRSAVNYRLRRGYRILSPATPHQAARIRRSTAGRSRAFRHCWGLPPKGYG